MSRPARAALVSQDDTGQMVVAAPTPGKIRWQRLVGEVVRPGSRLGILMQGQMCFDLVLPDGVQGGQVQDVLLSDPWTACEYMQALSHLTAPSTHDLSESATPGHRADAGGLYTVPSPTHGSYYRRPSPDSPPYVELGQEISRGDTLGLVEVMKCFSPIHFEPPAGFECGIVRELVAADGAEVPTESPLLRIELL